MTAKNKKEIRQRSDYTRYEELRDNNLQLVLSALIFTAFSIIMFINTSSNLLVKYDANYGLSIVTWVGLVGSAMWAIGLAAVRKRERGDD